MLSRRALTLTTPLLAAACVLPLNRALRDWSRQASFAVGRAEEDESRRAARAALAAYFYALGVLWDGAPLNFQPAAFAPGATEPTIRAISTALSEASADTPPRWATNEITSPRPTYEDRRLARLIRAADAPVQQLLLQLKTGVPAAEAELLTRIGEGHAVLLAGAGRLSQRETEREIMLALDALTRAIRRMPDRAPQIATGDAAPQPASLAAVFPP